MPTDPSETTITATLCRLSPSTIPTIPAIPANGTLPASWTVCPLSNRAWPLTPPSISPSVCQYLCQYPLAGRLPILRSMCWTTGFNPCPSACQENSISAAKDLPGATSTNRPSPPSDSSPIRSVQEHACTGQEIGYAISRRQPGIYRAA